MVVAGRHEEALSDFADELGGAYALADISDKAQVDAVAAIWLASDECFMTGQNLPVNDGLTLRRNPSLTELGDIAARATAHLPS